MVWYGAFVLCGILVLCIRRMEDDHCHQGFFSNCSCWLSVVGCRLTNKKNRGRLEARREELTKTPADHIYQYTYVHASVLMCSEDSNWIRIGFSPLVQHVSVLKTSEMYF
jgi:hypothetical protein